MLKKEKGITLVALVITIIILIIVASISIYEGTDIITNTKIQTHETNMLTIKAKAKSYGEDIDAALWALSGTDKDDKKEELLAEYGFVSTTINSSIESQLDDDITSEGYEAFSISDMLANNGLEEIQEDSTDGEYIVVYNAEDFTKLDVVYTAGVTYNGTVYYTLSKLQEVYSAE